MRQALVSSVLLVFLVLGLGSATAADLKIDGQASATKTMGDPIALSVTGTPGMPVSLLVDINAGPVSAFGQSLPLGFTSLVVILPLGNLPASGTLTLNENVPVLASLHGQTLYFLAAVFDPAFPFGLDFSSGADLTIVQKPTAGANQATLVGRKVVLDGGDVAQPDGTIQPGKSILWTVVQSPAGSTASVSNPTRPFATLTPDLPGDYVVRAIVGTGSANVVSATTVHAWSVGTTPFGDGSVLPLTSFDVNGTVSGPPVATLSVDGQTTALSNGAFGPLTLSFGPAEVVDTHHVRLTHADGSTANWRMSVFRGTGFPFDQGSTKALAAQVNKPALDMVAGLGEEQLEAADIKSVLLALPPEQIANTEGPFGFTIFSASIDFDDLKYDADMTLTLQPTAGGIAGKVTIKNIKADFSVWGEILEIDYNLDGYITTNPTIINATLVGSAQNGTLKIDVTNVTVDRQNFDFELTGFVGSVAELFVIESAVKEDVEATIAGTIQSEMGPAIEEILNSFVLAGSLQSILDVDMGIAAPITGVVHSSQGVTVQLDGKATVGVPEPGSPDVTLYRATPTLPVVFGPNAPSGQPYGAGLSMADDFVNQILAAGTAAGLLDGDLTSLIPAGGSPVTLATDQLAVLFPNSGFDLWPVNTEVKLRAHGTVPPTLQMTPTGPSMGIIHLPNLEVDFVVETPYGDVPLLLVSMNGAAEVDLGASTSGRNLEVTLVNSNLVLDVLRIYPGASPALMDNQVGFLGAVLDVALPQIIDALGSVPLPSLEAAGLGLTPNEVDLIGPNGEHIGFFGDLVVSPGP